MKVIKAPLTLDANAPATFARAGTAWYFDYAGVIQSAGTNSLRLNWDYETHAFQGMLVEGAATNYFINNATVGNRTITVVSGNWYTLSFYGDASGNSTTITLGGAGSGTLVSAGANKRVTKTFQASSTSLTLTVTGTGTGKHGQLEDGLSVTSVIVTAGASVTRPADVITGTGIFYNAFTDATAAYAGGTTYALAAVIQYAGRLWESLQASNTGHQPDISPTWWADAGPNNVTAAFDLTVSTRSWCLGAEALICVKAASAVDCVACLNMAGVYNTHIVISSTGKGGTGIYTAGSGYLRNSWSKDASSGTYITIIISSESGFGGPYENVNVGEIVMGMETDLGGTNYNLATQLIDYSKKVTDPDTGVTTFSKGANSKRLSGTVNVTKAAYNATIMALLDVMGIPTAWKGTDDTSYDEGTLFAGFLKDAGLVISYPTYNLLRIEIESLV